MISDYSSINLSLFSNSSLFVHDSIRKEVNLEDNSIQYFNINFGNKIDSEKEIRENIVKLKSLGICINSRYFDKAKQQCGNKPLGKDCILELTNINFDKINILQSIIQEYHKSDEIIDTIVKKLLNKYNSVDRIYSKFSNINELYIFKKDFEIVIHSLLIEDENRIEKLKTLAYGEEIVSDYKEFKTKTGDIITYNIEEKIIKVNDKLVKQSKQLLFCIALFENKGKKCSYEYIKNFFKNNNKAFEKNINKDIGEQINTLYNNIKGKKSDLKPLFENIKIKKGVGYYIS